jgi:TP901 family phage tail tape measure protein
VSVDVTANVSGFQSAFRTMERTAQYGYQRMGRYARDHGAAMEEVGDKATVMGAAIIAGIGLAVKSWMDFSDRMVQVQVASDATAAELERLSQAALTMGTNFGMSALDVADAQIELGKAGLSAGEMLSGGLAGALGLAAAGQINVGEATEIATSALSQFNLKGKDVPHIADLLAAGANKALGGVDELGMALKQGGLVASSFGISIDETVGTLAAFAQQGLLGSDAGTSMKTMLIALANPSKEAAAQMRELGIDAYDAQGNFVGLAGLAGQLQSGMKDLTQEQRNQAMATIFGTDAIRTANVLFKEGADGIRQWTKDVSQSGYASEAAMRNMDSLSGDFKKLSSTFQNGLIEMGKQSDGFLRPVVQGVTDAIKAFNDLPEPVKGAGLTMAAAAGGALLLGGGFLSLAPRVFDTINGFRELTRTAPGVAGALGKIGKAAGGVALAATALIALTAALSEKHVTSASDYAEAITRISRAGANAKASDLDSVFDQWDKNFGVGIVGANGFSEAIGKMLNADGYAQFNANFDGLRASVGAAKSEVGQVQDKLKGLGDVMGQMVATGAGEKAASTFRVLASEFERNGKSAKDALDSLPGYRDALKDVANQAGVTLDDQELLELALGRVPSKLQAVQSATESTAAAQQAAKQATDEQVRYLSDLGLTIQGVVSDLEKFISGLSRAGLSQLSTRDAVRGYEEALDSVSASIQKNGTSLDINTEQGRNNQAALDGIARSGFTVLDAMAKQTDANGKHVYSQQQLQDKLKGTYTDLVNNAGQFGITGDAADTLARDVLGIPKNANIDTWMSDYAQQKAAETKAAIDAIPKHVTVGIYTTEYFNRIEQRQTLPDLNGDVSGSGRFGGPAEGGIVPEYLATGGIAKYFGRMRPIGTDTIPAMLTPGEFVLKKQAALDLGYDNLRYANTHGVWPGQGAQSGTSITQNNTYNEAVSPAEAAQETMRRLAFASA